MGTNIVDLMRVVSFRRPGKSRKTMANAPKMESAIWMNVCITDVKMLFR